MGLLDNTAKSGNKNKPISKFKGARTRKAWQATKMSSTYKNVGKRMTAGKSVSASAVKKDIPTTTTEKVGFHQTPRFMTAGSESTAPKYKAMRNENTTVKLSAPKKKLSIFGRKIRKATY